MVVFDIAILAAGYSGSAPRYLTQIFPVLLAGTMSARAYYWLPRHLHCRPAPIIARDINRLSYLGSAAAFACTLWALALYQYGNLEQQSLVHYILAVTCFTGILGLGHSPLTAVGVSCVTIVPSTAWFLLYDHPNALAVCAVQVVVSGLLLTISLRHHSDFVALEHSRQEVAAREAESAALAARDALTGVPNRRAILTSLGACLADTSTPSPWLAMLDLDGFKHVNDTFGHPAGDAVLQTISRRIGQISEVMMFGRLGGDEFALLLPGELPSSKVHEVLTALIASISQPISFDGKVLAVSASIGLRLTRRKSVNECLERADEALYKAKERPGRVVEFTASDEGEMRERRAIARLFCSADLSQQIDMVYQPVVDFDTRRTVAVEALARWCPDGSSWIMPTTFVALAESTGRSSDLTAAVLHRAICEVRSVPAITRLAVNLSANDLTRVDAAEWICGIVRRAGGFPHQLTLEVTETAVIADLERAARTLESLRRAGFRISLDDFGTGQASLSRVHRLPLDEIKIDRSFAQALSTDAAGRAVASTILSLARQLRLDCTIEGIETIDDAHSARLLGLRSMQGYLFGRPAKIEQLRNRLVA